MNRRRAVLVPGEQPQRYSATAAVAVLGASSGVGYVAVHGVERAMFPLTAAGGLYAAYALYVAGTVALFLAYGGVVKMASRGMLDRGRARALALLFPLVFATMFTLGRPLLSIDVFTYIAQGRQAVSGSNPYAQPLRDLAGTPAANDLVREGWLPVHGLSPYGPLWTQIEAAVAGSTASVRQQMVILKAIAGLFAFGCAWLIWAIVGGSLPGSRMLAAMLFAWNPAIIGEFAGEGHNDALMIFFVLLSVYLFLKKRLASGVLALGIGALVKITASVIAPLQMAYACRTQRRARLVAAVLIGVAGVLLVGAAAYARFWAGAATFDGLRAHGHPSVAPSTPGALLWLLTRSHSEETSVRLLSAWMTGTFLCCLGVAVLTVKDARSLLRACGWVAFAYVLVAPTYWPWYACLPIALLALSPSGLAIPAIFAVSVGSRLSAPVDVLRRDGLMTWPQEVLLMTLIGVWLPAAAVGWSAVWRRSRTRETTPIAEGYSPPVT